MGSNGYGELGDGTRTEATQPVPVTGLANAVGVYVGHSSSCALLADGTLSCWGDNSEGQLGRGDGLYNDPKLGAMPVAGLSGVTAVATGTSHACAIANGGQVYCWGSNRYGQLATTGIQYSDTPRRVADLADAVDLAADAESDFTCALRRDGSVACWGDNQLGTLGRGASTRPDETPAPVMTATGTLGGVQSLQTAGNYSCAIVADGTSSVWCWGRPVDQQVSTVAVVQPGFAGSLQFTASVYDACARFGDGQYRCIGNDDYGQIGVNGTAGPARKTPAPVPGWQGDAVPVYASVSNGRQCALRRDGSWACMGRGFVEAAALGAPGRYWNGTP